jgi:hypothetical protein
MLEWHSSHHKPQTSLGAQISKNVSYQTPLHNYWITHFSKQTSDWLKLDLTRADRIKTCLWCAGRHVNIETCIRIAEMLSAWFMRLPHNVKTWFGCFLREALTWRGKTYTLFCETVLTSGSYRNELEGSLSFNSFFITTFALWHQGTGRGARVVGWGCYKPEDRWFDFRWDI